MSTWPPPEGPLTKVVPRSKAIVSVHYATIVHAPAALVFDAILNVGEYKKWNTWIPVARIVLQPPSADPNSEPDFNIMRVGSLMTFDAIMDASKPDKAFTSQLKVMDISTPEAPSSYIPPEMLKDPTFTEDLSKVYRVSWSGHGGFISYGLKLERIHEVIVRGPNECEVRNWEVMGGVIAHAVKWMHQSTLEEKLPLWCEDLRKFSEAKAGEGK